MSKVSLDTIDAKLDNVIASLNEVRAAEKLNTEFRLEAKGVLGFVTLSATILGGLVLWIGQKVLMGGK